jgi:hypothetical protein
MSAVERGWRRLGVVLVEAGLISEDDLVEALAVQEHSERRLGEILVARGIVSAPALANALAEQHGSFLKSEHGFGTGLRSLLNRESETAGETSEVLAPPLSEPQAPSEGEDRPTEATKPASPDPDAFMPGYGQATALPGEHSEDAIATDARDQPQSEHLLFVPTPQGYLLLERSGPAPTQGEVIELPEVPITRVLVAKVTSSPLPQDRRACAYLQPL